MTREAPSASAPAVICEATRGVELTVPSSFLVERGRASPQGPLDGTCRSGRLTLQGFVRKDTANSQSQPTGPLMLEASALPPRKTQPRRTSRSYLWPFSGLAVHMFDQAGGIRPGVDIPDGAVALIK